MIWVPFIFIDPDCRFKCKIERFGRQTWQLLKFRTSLKANGPMFQHNQIFARESSSGYYIEAGKYRRGGAARSFASRAGKELGFDIVCVKGVVHSMIGSSKLNATTK